jgi:hypothetical protein
MRWLTLVLLLSGCATIGSPENPVCSQLRFEQRAWSATAMAGAGIAGVSSAAAPIADEWASDEDRGDWQLGLGITGAVGGALSILGTAMGAVVAEDAVAAGCGSE